VSSSSVQMNGRYPRPLVDQARDYAVRERLPLNVVLRAALAEYLARRGAGHDDPAPQLHYRRGRPDADAMRSQEQIMRIDPRGRRLWRRGSRATARGEAGSTGSVLPAAA
jgi:hypothetical protein